MIVPIGKPVWYEDSFGRSKSQTFLIPVDWLQEQLLYYQLNSIDVIKIAYKNGQLFIEGFDPDDTDTKDITYSETKSLKKPSKWAEEWPKEN